MTDDELPDPARRALDRHDAFEAREDGSYECTTTPFEATVTAAPAEGERDATVEIEVRVPGLDAAVEGETVAEVVEDGWFETLELRLEDAYDPIRGDAAGEPVVERRGDEVVAEFAVRSWNADRGVEDAKAVIDYVEGTYVQGVVPGYDYGDPVAGLLQQARQTGEGGSEGADGAERGGTPL